MDEIYDSIQRDLKCKEADKERMKAISKLELRLQCLDFSVQTLMNYKYNEDVEAFRKDSKLVRELYDLSTFDGEGLDQLENESYKKTTLKIHNLFDKLKDIYEMIRIKMHFEEWLI